MSYYNNDVWGDAHLRRGPSLAKVDWSDGLGSFAAVCGMYVGHIANWTHVLPSPAAAQAAFDALPASMRSDLISRAANHGLEGWELMQKVPQVLWDEPLSFNKWLEIMDISHVTPTSVDPSLANDSTNWTWELSGVNRARGAETMSGSEFRAANEAANDAANAPWWDFNEMLRGFMDSAALAGYTMAWLPKTTWSTLMNALKQLWTDMNEAKTFGKKLSVARKFAYRIFKYCEKNGKQLTAAFALGVLTFIWPPCTFFIAAWGATGLLSIVVSVLRKACAYGMGNPLVASIAKLFEVPLKHLFTITNAIRSFLDKIKNGIFQATMNGIDWFFTSFKKVATILQPHVAKIVEKAVQAAKQVAKTVHETCHRAVKVVKTVVKTVVKAVSHVLTGFINWVGSFFGGPSTALA